MYRKKKKKSVGGKRSPIPCHVGPVEVIKNLFCGSWREALKMVEPPYNVDVLVPLNDLDGSVWSSGFRGEILYYPITDFSILPNDVLDDVVYKIISRLELGKRVGVFCAGGHGRTGYIVAVVLGILGHKDPIGFLRKKYCKEAVESSEQIRHIAERLDIPELITRYPVSFAKYYDKWDYGYRYDSVAHGKKCSDCFGYIKNNCEVFGIEVDGDDSACELFLT